MTESEGMKFGDAGLQASGRRNEEALSHKAGDVPDRRRELVHAAVSLFVKNGYHETTTRDIAQAAGWSVGALYEFVKSKGDILYHVIEMIHEETGYILDMAQDTSGTTADALRRIIDTYYRACDTRQDVIVLIYQETNCLSPELRSLVAKNEERLTGHFQQLIEHGVANGEFNVEGPEGARLMAHDIAILGQMWAFRRWFIQKHFTLEEYIATQTRYILCALQPVIRERP